MNCVCEAPGFCERFVQPMPGRLWELCSGKCPAERPCPDEATRLRSLKTVTGVAVKAVDPATIVAAPTPAPAAAPSGPGTELKALLASLGLTPASGCDCNARAAQMNAWGVAGCRERRAEIVAWLREQATKASWSLAAVAAWKALKGFRRWFRVRDPLGSIVDEAIRRAEGKEKPL